MSNATSDPIVRAVVTAARDLLGGRLLCVAQIGSLAHGGFSPISDIDLAIVVADADGDAWVDAVKAAARASDPVEAARLSIFWGDRALGGGRFPPLDRLDLIAHGVPVFGALPDGMVSPSADEVRGQLRQSSIPYWGEKTAHFIAHEPVSEDKELVRCLLYPARLAYSWRTGGITSNDEAVARLLAEAPPTLDTEPVTVALAFRHGCVPYGALVRYRARLRSQYEETLRWLNLRIPLPTAH